MDKPIFYDPLRKRWGRLRLLFNALGLLISTLIVFFVITVFFQKDRLPGLGMPVTKRNLHAVNRSQRRKTASKGSHRKTKAAPSDIVLKHQAVDCRGDDRQLAQLIERRADIVATADGGQGGFVELANRQARCGRRARKVRARRLGSRAAQTMRVPTPPARRSMVAHSTS